MGRETWIWGLGEKNRSREHGVNIRLLSLHISELFKFFKGSTVLLKLK